MKKHKRTNTPEQDPASVARHNELQRTLLALLEEHGHLERKDMYRLVNAETLGEKEEIFQILADLRKKLKVSLHGRTYSLCRLTEERLLALLRDRGAMTHDEIYGEVFAEKLEGQGDWSQVKKLLQQLKRQKKIGFVDNHWLLFPKLDEHAVLQAVNSRKGKQGASLEYLCTYFGFGREARSRTPLLRLLKAMEGDNQIKFYHDAYHLAGGDKGTPAAIRASQRDAMEGTYLPRRNKPAVEVVDAKHGSLTLSIFHSPIPLVPGDRVLVRKTSRSVCGEPQCDVLELVSPSERPLLLFVHTEPIRYLPGEEVWGASIDETVFFPGRGMDNGIFALRDVPDGLNDMDVVEAAITGREGSIFTARVIRQTEDFNAIFVHEDLTKLNHEVPRDFPDKVLREAAALPGSLTEADLAQRADLRDLPFVTMDGATAKDFDDAICVERDGHGGYLLRVAIADVSQYVRPGSSLDKEALDRGNSWYFPTSVEPMLPERLCNQLCSLVPGEDRPVMWANMECSAQGQVKHTSFGAGVIRSAARLTYDSAKTLALDKDEATINDFRRGNTRADQILAMLEAALELYRILAKTRRDRGSLDFDLPEPEADFDEAGKIMALRRAGRHDMHRLIEEFMIAANEAVAVFLGRSEIPVLYRVHPAPTQEKLEAFRRQLLGCGLVPHKTSFSSRRLPELLSQIRGTRGESVFNRLCVRAMAQARYSDENIGHYGLASQAYCHFTSPIRRYADLLVHRALKVALGIETGPIPSGKRLVRIADIINSQEKKAQECEREMNKRVACLWMRAQPSDRTWQATVSSVQPFGVFVELDEAPVEGLVGLRELGIVDWLEYDCKRECLRGEMTGVRFHVGSRLEVALNDVDPISLYINFRALPLPSSSGRGDRRKSRR